MAAVLGLSAERDLKALSREMRARNGQGGPLLGDDRRGHVSPGRLGVITKIAGPAVYDGAGLLVTAGGPGKIRFVRVRANGQGVVNDSSAPEYPYLNLGLAETRLGAHMLAIRAQDLYGDGRAEPGWYVNALGGVSGIARLSGFAGIIETLSKNFLFEEGGVTSNGALAPLFAADDPDHPPDSTGLVGFKALVSGFYQISANVVSDIETVGASNLILTVNPALNLTQDACEKIRIVKSRFKITLNDRDPESGESSGSDPIASLDTAAMKLCDQTIDADVYRGFPFELIAGDEIRLWWDKDAYGKPDGANFYAELCGSYLPS